MCILVCVETNVNELSSFSLKQDRKAMHLKRLPEADPRFESVLLLFLVREAEVILPTFSRDKSILLLYCPLDA